MVLRKKHNQECNNNNLYSKKRRYKRRVFPEQFRNSRRSKNKIEKKAAKLLERVGLDSRRTQRVEDLSGGEQQRVAIARALVMEPTLLLADEPTGNLDQKNSDSVHALLKELNKELNMTVIVVTHNNKFAKMMERTVTLYEGDIVSV